MSESTIAVALASAAADQCLVATWTETRDRLGQLCTHALADIWVGASREELERLATEARLTLTKPSTARLVLTTPNP